MSQQDNNYKTFEYDSYTELEQCLLNDFQHDFPLSSQPFKDIADHLDVETDLVIETYKKLQSSGAISRIGPVIKPNAIGNSILAALKVPNNKLVETADMISFYAEVNHNYEREHEFNLWFVITAKDEDRLNYILDEIEKNTGCPLLRLPLLDAYHIDLGFNLK